MTADQEYQVRHLERIFEGASMAPIFRRNPKYPVQGVARMAYSDVMERRYVVRNDQEFEPNAFWDGKADAIATYPTLEALVMDGWRLD